MDFQKESLSSNRKTNGKLSSAVRYLPILSCRSFKGLSSQFYFGEGSFNRRQALILSEIEGITLRELAKQVESNIEEETLELSLENAFGESYKLGAEHYDLNLGNFLFCANGQVVVIDLGDIEFHDRQQAWELSLSMGYAYYLMSRFRDVRYPRRPPSPVLYSEMPVALGCTGPMSCCGSLRKSRFEQ